MTANNPLQLLQKAEEALTQLEKCAENLQLLVSNLKTSNNWDLSRSVVNANHQVVPLRYHILMIRDFLITQAREANQI